VFRLISLVRLGNGCRIFRRVREEFASAASHRIYEKAGISTKEPSAPWALLAKIILVAGGVPLIVLAVGASLWWAVAGFTDLQNKTE
jgi:hypothetical protein